MESTRKGGRQVRGLTKSATLTSRTVARVNDKLSLKGFSRKLIGPLIIGNPALGVQSTDTHPKTCACGNCYWRCRYCSDSLGSLADLEHHYSECLKRGIAG